MKQILCVLLILVFVFSGCTNKFRTQVTTPDTFSPTPTASDQNNTLDSTTLDEIYCFDLSKEWDAGEYQEKFGQDLNYFSAPIQSPYKYVYKCESLDITIDEVANALGTIMMEDFMHDYEGKTFIVTEYKNLVSHVMTEDEFNEWEERFSKAGKNVVLKENQWLCTFDCDYKYTGDYAGIGEMPIDWEWMKILTTDGSGEDHAFIIEKVSNDEYIMRGIPKTIIEVIKN